MKNERKKSGIGNERNERKKRLNRKRKYTYNEIYSAVNKISAALERAGYSYYEDNREVGFHENLFRDYAIFITFINHIKIIIRYVHRDLKPERFVGDESFTLIEEVYITNKFNKDTPLNDIWNKFLLKIYNEKDYFSKIKEDLFPKNIQLNWSDIKLDLPSIMKSLCDTSNFRKNNKCISFINLSKDIEKLLGIRDIEQSLSIGDIDELMAIQQSNKNRFYIPYSFQRQLLGELLSRHIKPKQNLVCLGINPHIMYMSYRNSFREIEKFDFKVDEENIEIYFEEQSDFYNNLYPILLNLQSELPYINILEEEVLDASKDTLVLTINNMENVKDSAPFDSYSKTLKYATKRAFMLAPYSMISNQFLDNFDNSEMFERYISMIKNKHIEKIFLFPNGYFTHTAEAQVLLEISKEQVEGIHFIDLNLLPYRANRHAKEFLFEREHLESISKWYEHKDLMAKDKTDISISLRLSKWVSYSDIINIHNYNISPNYHLVEIDELSGTSPISDYFDVKKLQRFNFFKGTHMLRIFAITDFKEFGFTCSRDIHKSIRFEAPMNLVKIREYEKLKDEDLDEIGKRELKNYNKFKHSYQLQKYDILIYVNDPSIITIVDISYTYTIASHNLIRLRVNKINGNKIEELSKALYLFLLSKIGQQSLHKILLRGKVGRDVLPIDTLKNIKVDFQNLPKQVKKFDKLQKQQEQIDTIRESMKNDILK